MAIGLRVKFDEGTQGQYEAVNAQAGAGEGPLDIKFPVHNPVKP